MREPRVVSRKEEKAAALASASASWQGERAAKVCLNKRRIRPRFALASTSASRADGRPLKEMPPEDSCGMEGWAWLEGRPFGLGFSVLEILPNFRSRNERQCEMSCARSRPRYAQLCCRYP